MNWTKHRKGIIRSVRLDVETDDLINKIAEQEDRSISYILNKLIKQSLKQQSQEDTAQ